MNDKTDDKKRREAMKSLNESVGKLSDAMTGLRRSLLKLEETIERQKDISGAAAKIENL